MGIKEMGIQEGETELHHRSFPPALQAGPDSISRCGRRTASAAASSQATAFATCPAVRAPTSWTAPHGGPWAAGGSSWHGPLWVAALSCCTGTPSTVGPTAIACTRPPVALCTLSWACCCATSTAMVWNADPAPAAPRRPLSTPGYLWRGRMARWSEAWAGLETVRSDPSQGRLGLLSWPAPQAQWLPLSGPVSPSVKWGQ